MKIIYKGVFKNNEQLPVGDLPSGAVKFDEPDSIIALSVVASIFIIPAAILVGAVLMFSSWLHGGLAIEFDLLTIFIASLLALLTVVPHELLHAVCFGKDAEVEVYVAPKQMSAFVVSTHPVSKSRFIFLSLLPNIVFGWLPLVVWAFLPQQGFLMNVFFIFSISCILFGIGDYLNAFNAARQMPKGSMQQLSGFHSYWFMP